MSARELPTLELPRKRFELSCGVTLIVSPRPGAPVTAMRALIRGGPSLDPQGKEGLAYLTGRLVDQGTERHGEEELAALLEPAGAEISGGANGIGGTIAGSEWKLLARLSAELLRTPTYPDELVKKQKRRLLSRLFVEQEDPRRQGELRFRRLVYGEHWLGRPAYGSYESVARIRARDLRAHHKRTWCGKRCLIGVCGDVDPQAVRRLFERELRGWQPGRAFQPAAAILPRRAVRTDVFRASREQVHLYLGHLGIERSNPDYAALTVMDHVLGTGPGFTNRISRRLRDELGLAYTVHADIHSSAGLLPGTFTAYIGTSPEHLATAVHGFQEEIRGIQSTPVQDEELATAKNYLLGSFALGFERASRRASYLVASELHAFPEDNLVQLPRQFAAVTADDVLRVSREHLFPDACCLAASGPTSKRELMAVLKKRAATRAGTSASRRGRSGRTRR